MIIRSTARVFKYICIHVECVCLCVCVCVYASVCMWVRMYLFECVLMLTISLPAKSTRTSLPDFMTPLLVSF
jgi:hypothetical protein